MSGRSAAVLADRLFQAGNDLGEAASDSALRQTIARLRDDSIGEDHPAALIEETRPAWFAAMFLTRREVRCTVYT
jgi:hypothetical protein